MTQNPWTREQSPGPQQPQPGPGPQPDITPRGPSAPQHGVPAPAEDQRLPKFAIPAADTLWWVGVHGGSGETTMSVLLPGTRASNHRWPIPPPPVPTPVILVARTHGSGLRAAQRAAIEWASGVVQGVAVLGLVLISDAPGRLPRVLDDFADIVGGGVPRVWDIPWIEEWRRGEAPTPDNTPDEVFEVLESIYALRASNPADYPAPY
ncbi:DUF6668 family protein [Kribbella sindirgiensis]|uniref:Uncharacterized protein n=1 Tax=Kribbella sindirgiensis TaxID=1124744 RepID=A0A4V2M6E2_9ACTN|nr:DUF6668 family protein [Kribbella sindirgiensis]TCC43382.1 hypothetical protein E0H50_02615 [Kribbella sindirgiensis]